MSRSISFLNSLKSMCILAVFFATGQAFPATFHVATDGSGNFTTIAQVNAHTFAAGDSCLFRRGDVWREQLMLNNSGTAAAPLTFGAYGDTAQPLPRILGSTNCSAAGKWSNGGSGNLWHWTDTLGGATSENEVSNIILNTDSTAPSCAIRDTATPTAQGHWYWNSSTHIVYLYSTSIPSTAYPNGIEVAVEVPGNQGQVLFGSGANYIVLQDIDIRYSGCTGIITWWAGGEHDITIDGCSVSYCGGAGPAQGATRLGNGIQLANSGSNMTVKNCRIDQIFDGALGIESVNGSTTFSNVYIYNNVISNFDNGLYIKMPSSGTVSNIYYENNTLIDAGMGWGNAQRMGADSYKTHLFLCCSGGSPTLSSVYIRNNLFYGTNPSTRGIIFYGWSNGSSGMTLDYNSFSLADANVFYIQTGGGTFTYANFNSTLAGTGFLNKTVNSHSLTADPLLVYPVVGSTEDFHLGSGSPCIDHGTANGCGRTTDYDTDSIVGAPDIGAYEYQAGGSASPTQTPTRTSTPTITPTRTPTQAPTITPTPTRTPTITPMPTTAPTITPTQTPTCTPTQTPTMIPTPTRTPTQTPTMMPTQTPTRTPTQTPTMMPTQTPTATPTKTPTQAPTLTPTPTVTPTVTGKGTSAPPTNTPTATPTVTPIPPTPTPTPMPAPHININPASMSPVSLNPGQAATRQLTISNTGSIPLNFSLSVVAGGNGQINSTVSEESAAPQSVDTASPAAIADLSAAISDFNSVTLNWTATGNDGASGTAASYDIRYSTSMITDSNWAQASQASGAPVPAPSGSAESFTIGGLFPSTTYCFGIRAADNMGNTSTLSNIATGATTGGMTAFSDDFERGSGAWQATGLWHMTDHRAASPSHAFYYGIDSQWNYKTTDTNSGTLTSPPISLEGAQKALICFNYWRQVESYNGPFDVTLLQASLDGGANWTQVWYKDSSTVSTSTWEAAAPIAINSIQGNASLILRFFFVTDDAVNNDYEGWYIDDVRVLIPGSDSISVVPLSGVVPAGGQAVCQVQYDSQNLAPGSYSFNIVIHSNDAAHSSLQVPATLEVLGPPSTPTPTLTPTPTETPHPFPATPTPVSGWLHTFQLLLNKNSFVSGDVMNFDAHVIPCTNCGNQVSDAYVAVLTPSNMLFFLTDTLGLSSTPVPFATNVPIQQEIESPIASFLISGIASGNYLWMGVLTAPGASPLYSANWTSNLAVMPWTAAIQ